MKRILSIFIKDLKCSTKDFMLLYMLVIPLILAVILKFFIPDVEENALTFAIDQNVDQAVIQQFEEYGKVELFSNHEDLEKRVLQLDDVEGIMVEDGGYVVLSQGNEKQQVVEGLLKSILADKSKSITVTSSDNNYKLSPISSIGAATLIIMAITLSGMLIGLSIIDEKESRAIQAIRVGPASKLEYILGKSALGFFALIVQSVGILFILRLNHINFWMIMVITLASYLVALIYGFIIGVTSPNQMAGMATTKVLMILVAASVVGALLLPDQLQVLLYWSPIYWSFVGIYEALLESISWQQISLYSLFIIIITIVVYMAFRKKIHTGLNANS